MLLQAAVREVAAGNGGGWVGGGRHPFARPGNQEAGSTAAVRWTLQHHHNTPEAGSRALQANYLVVRGTLLHQTFTRVSSDACKMLEDGQDRC